MLYALIIDDEENGLISLELLIKEFMPEVKVVATSTDAVKGVELINNFRPDIVFLDINMPNLNGFEVLEKIEFKKFHLIFTTAHSEYALRAIKKQAIDYLLKPVDEDDLRIAVEKVKRKIKENDKIPDAFSLLKEINERSQIKITVPTKSGIDMVSPDEIIYIEADLNNSVVTVKGDSQLVAYRSLKEYEIILCKQGSDFLRIHNSFIINIKYVTKYLKEDGGYAVISKKTIPISKQKKEEFLKRINLSSE